MTELSAYVLEPIREGPDFTLYRGRQHGNPSRVLAVALAAEDPSPQGLGGLSTNTRSQPNSIPHGQPSLWRSLVMKGGQSSYSWTLAVSRLIWFFSGVNRSI